MQRDNVRITTSVGPPIAKVDVPIGVFTSGDLVQYDGEELLGVSLATLELDAATLQARTLKIASLRA